MLTSWLGLLVSVCLMPAVWCADCSFDVGLVDFACCFACCLVLWVVLCFGFWVVVLLILVVDLNCVLVNSVGIMLFDYLYVDLLFGDKLLVM